MPAIINVPFLLAVIVVGSAVSVFLLLLTVAVRAGRYLAGQFRRRLEAQLRPLVLRAVAGESAIAENVGFRQVYAWWRLRGMLGAALRRKATWLEQPGGARQDHQPATVGRAR